MGTAQTIAIDRRAAWAWILRVWEARAAAAGPCLRLRLRAALYDLDQRIAEAERGECAMAAVRGALQRLRALTADPRSSSAPRSAARPRGA